MVYSFRRPTLHVWLWRYRLSSSLLSPQKSVETAGTVNAEAKAMRLPQGTLES